MIAGHFGQWTEVNQGLPGDPTNWGVVLDARVTDFAAQFQSVLFRIAHRSFFLANHPTGICNFIPQSPVKTTPERFFRNREGQE